jgi:thiamine-phosphate pyrophosphorylase
VLSLPDLDERARALGRYGDVALHVRSAALPVTARLDLARRFRAAARCVLINDRADLVPSAGADGVHLPARGIPVPTARDLLGPAAVVGRSVHSPREARAQTALGADYVFLGPIWETPSHPGVPGLGLAALAEAQPARVVAIGGLTPERAAACLAAGAWGVAAVSALWLADDPAAAAEAFLLSLGLQP